MIQKKSFDLVSEEAPKRRGNMYAARKCRCMRCIAIPALVAFMLLLILANVDFDGVDESDSTTPDVPHIIGCGSACPPWWIGILSTEGGPRRTTEATASTDATDSANINFQPAIARLPVPTHFLTPGSVLNGCTNTPNKCNVTCSGNVYYLYKDLEDMQPFCSQPLHLTLKDCKFQNDIIDDNLFIGFYKLQSLVIKNCPLRDIDESAFLKSSVSGLKSLELYDVQLNTLTASNFKGLSAVKYFVLANSPYEADFSGYAFLEPMNDTIVEVNLQISGASGTAYDPKFWLAGMNYTQLQHVQLSNNNFEAMLTHETFVYLVQVVTLRLANCNISAIGEGTFNGLMSTLQYLDLRENQLSTLSGEFLLLLPADKVFHLELGGNKWNCTCDMKVLLSSIQELQLSFEEEAFCQMPSEFYGQQLSTVSLWKLCGDDTSTVVVTTTEITTTTTTTEITTTTTPEIKTTTLPVINTDTTHHHTTMPTTTDSTSTTSMVTPPSQTVVNLQHLVCYYYNTPNRPPFYQSAYDFDALFYVETLANGSVALHVHSHLRELSIMFFTPVDFNERIFSTNGSRPRTGTSIVATYHIDGLTYQQSYVFCLVPDNANKVSPFNCRGHYLDEWIEMVAPPWLHHTDQALFIALNMLGSLLAVLLGAVLLYWMLRWRPSWLKGNKRIQSVSQHGHKVYLLPKGDLQEGEYPYACCYHVNMDPSADVQRATHDRCQCERPKSHQSTGYMHYYKGLELANLKRNPRNVSLTPSECAPSAPSEASSSSSTAGSRPISSQSTVRVEDLIPTARVPRLGYEYQSLEIYEEIM